MAEVKNQEVKSQLVIIRRRGSLEDAYAKSGVWKIAYADFMTAMMAFFLVMWLLHTLNPTQRESIANYFNPIKLAESTPERKGLNDPQKTEPEKTESPDGDKQPGGANESPQGNSETPEKPARYDEGALFRDPYSVLTEIAGGSVDAPAQGEQQQTTGNPRSAQEEGMIGGEAYRDPFDPSYWKHADNALTASKTAQPENVNRSENQQPAQKQPDAPGVDTAAAGSQPASDDTPATQPKSAQPPSENQAAAQPAAAGDAAQNASREDGLSQAVAKQLQAAIDAMLAKLGLGSRPFAEVRRTDEGLLISLTDNATFGMFAIGSAEPQPELVRVVDKIGPLLSAYPGVIIVRGHTDNRPYRSTGYDNWRLSTARAQMAYHMLVRAGIPPERIEHVEGYADRKPKIPDDPAAAPNRRIEILIREPRH